jgi:Prokaryotic dksA/traR C4-type zinc finger
MIQQIDATLKRIDEGTYGQCDWFEDEIDWERIRALPTATLCIDCATAREKRQRAISINRSSERLIAIHSEPGARLERNRDGERTLIVEAIKRRSCIKRSPAIEMPPGTVYPHQLSPMECHGMGEGIYRSITRDGIVFLPWPDVRRRAERRVRMSNDQT